MKTTAMCALALLLATGMSAQESISISFTSEDSRTEVGPRREPRDARLAITTRDGSTMLMLMNDVLVLQLTDQTLSGVDSKKKDPNFLEELLIAGVKLAVGKSVEYPIAHIRSVDVRNGSLQILNEDGKPVFTEVKVNGTDVLRAFSEADAKRFVNAFRSRRR